MPTGHSSRRHRPARLVRVVVSDRLEVQEGELAGRDPSRRFESWLAEHGTPCRLRVVPPFSVLLERAGVSRFGGSGRLRMFRGEERQENVRAMLFLVFASAVLEGCSRP